MEKELIYSSEEPSDGYGAGSGTLERYEYKCPCGKGKIIEEYDNIPGFRDSDVFIECEECNKNYRIDTSNGIRSWEVVPK